jgi:uncharacterized OsmC-like protein
MPQDELKRDGDQVSMPNSNSSSDVDTLDPNDPEAILDVMAVASCNEEDARKLLKRLRATAQKLKPETDIQDRDDTVTPTTGNHK